MNAIFGRDLTKKSQKVRNQKLEELSQIEISQIIPEIKTKLMGVAEKGEQKVVLMRFDVYTKDLEKIENQAHFLAMEKVRDYCQKELRVKAKIEDNPYMTVESQPYRHFYSLLAYW